MFRVAHKVYDKLNEKKLHMKMEEESVVYCGMGHT